MTLRHRCRYRSPAPLVPDILAKAALALRGINQHELADIVMLLTLLGTTEQIAAVRGAIFTMLAT
jgi:hypothetical protein